MSTVGEDGERPSIARASIDTLLVESPMVHRSPATATAGSITQARQQRRGFRTPTQTESTTRVAELRPQSGRAQMAYNSGTREGRVQSAERAVPTPHHNRTYEPSFSLKRGGLQAL